MTPQEEQLIARWREHIPEKLPLTAAWKEDAPGLRIRGFCEDFQRLVPQVLFGKEEISDESMPEITVRENIRFSAVPEANEMEPFLRAMHSVEPLAADLHPSLREALERLDIPASIRVYISPQCPFCPQAVVQCLALADASRFCRVRVIDAALFPEQAEKAGIRSVPTITLDRAFHWTGSVKNLELVDMILHRDPVQLSSDSLEQMLRSGRAGELAKMISERGAVIPAFVDLLVNRKWPVRLGAMVAFQYLAEIRPDLASQIALSLWDRFLRVDDQIKGDILYLFGESGDRSLLPMLDSIVEGRHPEEIKEAARDAVKALKDRTVVGERSRLNLTGSLSGLRGNKTAAQS